MSNRLHEFIDSREGFAYEASPEDWIEYHNYLEASKEDQSDSEIEDLVLESENWIPRSLRSEKPVKPERDPRDVSVKFDHTRLGDVVEATPERLKIVRQYADDISSGREIQYDVDDKRQYDAEYTFHGAMVLGGVIDPS